MNNKSIKKWYKICVFLEKNNINFLECTDGIYRPDFRDYCKDKNKNLNEMNEIYIKTWEEYINEITGVT